MVGPRLPPALLAFPSEAEAAENKLSSSDMSISGALTKIPQCDIRRPKGQTKKKKR